MIVLKKLETLIIRDTDKAFVAAGKDRGAFKAIRKEYGHLKGTIEGLEKQKEIAETIQSQMKRFDETGKATTLRNDFFGNATKEKEVTEAFRQTQVSNALRKQLNGIDQVTKALSTGKSTKGLAEGMAAALDLGALSGKFFDKVIKESTPQQIDELTKLLGNSRKSTLLRRGVTSALAERAQSNLAKANVFDSNTSMKKIFGLEGKEFETVKKILGKERAGLLEEFLDKTIASQKAKEIFNVPIRTGSDLSIQGKFAPTAPRRGVETGGLIVLDMISSETLGKLKDKRIRRIMKDLANPDPKAVSEFLNAVSDRLETKVSSTGERMVRVIDDFEIPFQDALNSLELLKRVHALRGDRNQENEKRIEELSRFLSDSDEFNEVFDRR